MKFHINPRTGNPSACKANKGNCPFGGADEHFSDKNLAQKYFENVLKLEYEEDIKRVMESHLEDSPLLEDYPNIFTYSLFAMEKYNNNNWTEREREDLARVFVIEDMISKKDVRGAEEILSQFGIEETNEDWQKRTRSENLYEIGEKIIQSYYNSLIVDKAVNPRQPIKGLSNLRKSQLEILRELNEFSDGTYMFHKDIERYFDLTLNKLSDNRVFEPYTKRDKSEITRPKDLLLRALSNKESENFYNPLYLALGFPEKELKASFDKYNVENVNVSYFKNGRENGLVYTVREPNGNTRSFSVYEHRNSDSIIINGKTNWDGESLPYAEDSKNAFFAEFRFDDHEQVADALIFYLKNAQSGELQDDEYLVSNAQKLDWKAILSEQLPGFKDWIEKYEDKKKE